MLNRLSSGHRPILSKVKRLSTRGQSKLDSSSILGEQIRTHRALECGFSSNKLDPKPKDSTKKGQQAKNVQITFSPIAEPKSWNSKHRIPILKAEKRIQSVPNTPWITECPDVESLESVIFRAEGISDLLDILAKNITLVSENEVASLLLIQRLASKVSRAASLETSLEKPLGAEQFAGLKCLLGMIPNLLEKNLTPPTILSSTRLLSNLYAAIQYTDPLLQTTTKQVFTRVSELVRSGQFDQNPELLLLLVKEFARIHYSPRIIVDKIAKYISNNEVSFMTGSLERHAVLSFFSAVEIMWAQRKHPVLDAAAIYLENKIADITEEHLLTEFVRD